MSNLALTTSCPAEDAAVPPNETGSRSIVEQWWRYDGPPRTA
jgi:hypothetical protein